MVLLANANTHVWHQGNSADSHLPITLVETKETRKPPLLDEQFWCCHDSADVFSNIPLIIDDTMYPRPQVSLKVQSKALPACDSSSGSFDRGSDLLVVQREYVDACHLCLLRLRHHVCLARALS